MPAGMSSRILYRCRGSPHPEQSILAVREGLSSSVSGIALDLRLTADLHWVCIQGKETQGAVREAHLPGRHAPALPAQTLLALFSAQGEGKQLFLTLQDTGNERPLLKMLDDYDLLGKTVLISWEARALERIYHLRPGLRLGLALAPSGKEEMHKRWPRRGITLSYAPQRDYDRRARPRTGGIGAVPRLPLHSVHLPALWCSQRATRDLSRKGVLPASFPVSTKISENVLRRQGVEVLFVNKA